MGEVFFSLRKKTKKDFRWGLNQIRKDAETRFVRFPEGSAFTGEEAMDEMMRLNQSCWNESGRPGVFKRKRFRNFHKDVARCFHKTNQTVFFLYRDGKPVAVEYGFILEEKFYSYQAGYDPNYKKYGIGKVVQLLTIQYFF